MPGSLCCVSNEKTEDKRVCVLCLQTLMRAECTDTRSKAMSMLSVDQLCGMLRYVLQRMKHTTVSVFVVCVWFNSKKQTLPPVFVVLII